MGQGGKEELLIKEHKVSDRQRGDKFWFIAEQGDIANNVYFWIAKNTFPTNANERMYMIISWI